MIKTKKILFYVVFANIIIYSFIFTNCNSVKEPESVYDEPDYTEQDVRNNEISQIKDMLNNRESIKAMWRAYLLGDSNIINICVDKVVKQYNDFITTKKYYEAYRLYLSLEACGYEKLNTLSMGKQILENKINEETKNILTATKSETFSKDDSVKNYINGTVTVWVDGGIAIKNGMGYSSVVIGSGFFIDKSGYIVTNNHVIESVVDPKNENTTKLYIKLASDSDTKIPAKVIGWDPVLDLALLKTEIDAPYVFKLGSSNDLDVGDKIYVIGSPVGLGRTLTSGIVSATDRKLFTTGSVMQIEAAVNSGNSGGPCISESGVVQAIVFAGMEKYEGLNFAIPVEYLKTDLPMLFHGGEVSHSWVASYGHTKKLGTTDKGFEVQYVMPGGSANRAGLKESDVITAVEGEPVLNLEQLQDKLRRYIPRTIIKITAKDTAGVKKDYLVYLEKRPAYPGYDIYEHDHITGSFIPILGMKLISASTYGHKYSIEKVINGTTADDSGFSEGDPVEINKVKFTDDKSAIYVQIDTSRKSKNYFDTNMALAASLDNPYYF